MLSVPSEYWPDRVPFDRTNPRHPFKGKNYTFDQMVELRQHASVANQVTPEIRAQWCQRPQVPIVRNPMVDGKEGSDGRVYSGSIQLSHGLLGSSDGHSSVTVSRK